MEKVRAPQYDEPLPDRLLGRHRDHRGFIAPFFVQWFHEGHPSRPGVGLPDFRVVSPVAFNACIRFDLCWLCGQPLGKHRAFVLGPMCVVTRTNSEPASHRECATYSLKTCPFLTKPNMKRNEGYEMPVISAPGDHQLRNPGLMALWVSDGAQMFNAESGQQGILFEVNDPFEVVWWREGRLATRAEVELGLAQAMPFLEAEAASKGRQAIAQLERMSQRALAYIPPEAAP